MGPSQQESLNNMGGERSASKWIKSKKLVSIIAVGQRQEKMQPGKQGKKGRNRCGTLDMGLEVYAHYFGERILFYISLIFHSQQCNITERTQDSKQQQVD